MAHDWIVTSAVHLGIDSQLQFQEKNQYVYGAYYTYHGVWISTGSGDPSDGDFVELMEYGNEADNWVLRTIDLSEYANRTIYIGFYYQGDYDSLWRIDDVTITGEPAPAWLTVNGTQHVEDSVMPGSTEMLSVEFDATGLTPGTYRATLMTVPDNDQEMMLTPVVLEVSEFQLVPPENVLIVTDADTVILTWDSVDGATSYRVYSSEEPETGWLPDESGTLDGTIWTAPSTETKRFYRVTCLME